MDMTAILTSAALIDFLGQLAGAVAIMLVFVIIVRIVEPMLRRAAARDPVRVDVLSLLITAGKWAFLIFGVITALGTLGVDTAALVAGLGLTGLTIGFALKDVVASFMAGLLLMLYRPFRRGDRVAVTGLEGTVIDLDLRYTHLAGDDGQKYLIPNSTVLTNAVTVLPSPAPGSP